MKPATATLIRARGGIELSQRPSMGKFPAHLWLCIGLSQKNQDANWRVCRP
jgi:hypothetical protein